MTAKRKSIAVIHLGCPGHLISIAQLCRWRRHTQIGDSFRVSTLGDYYPRAGSGRDTLGASDDSFFETMVFVTLKSAQPNSDGCGCHAVRDWAAQDSARYATAGAAQKGHDKFVAKYLRLAEDVKLRKLS